jgi:hypothetical protein
MIKENKIHTIIFLTYVPMIIRFGLSFFLIIYFGFILGIILIYLLFKLYELYMFYFYGLENITGIEKIYITQELKNRFQILSYFKISNFNKEKLKNFLIEKYFSSIKKFRQKLILKYYEYWLFEVPKEEVLKAIKILNEPINNDEELLKFCQNELNNHIDIFNNLPYMCYLAQSKKKNEGYLIFKFDHSMTDGLGLISSICSAASNYSKDSFPSIIKNIKNDPFLEKLYYWLVFPYYSLRYALLFIPFLKDYKSPLSVKNYNGNSLIAKSKNYRLKDFEKYRKHIMKISFNSFMICVISSALDKLTEKKELKNKIRIFIPYCRKKLPKDIKDVDLKNKTVCIISEVPIIKDLSPNNIKLITNSINKYFDKRIQFMYYKLSLIGGEYTTVHFLENIVQLFCSKFQLAFTNVPGPTSKLNFEGNEIENLTTFIKAGRGMTFIPLMSYNNYFNFTIAIDESTNIKPEKIIELIENELDNILKQTKNYESSD